MAANPSLPRRLGALAAGLALAAGGVALTAGEAQAVDVYITEGTHHVNGRVWRTVCEPYSQTERCRTEIQATVVKFEDGRFVQVNGWAFNNLTYKASPRSLWKGNPLAADGVQRGTSQWTALDGRQWRTECDTDATGFNGCRSYIQADVIAATPAGYQWQRQWVFNNMVRFSPVPGQPTPTAAPTTPALTPEPTATPEPTEPTFTPTPGDLSFIDDDALRQCVDEQVPSDDLTSLDVLVCSDEGVTSLEGLQYLTSLTELEIDDNAVTDLTPLADLTTLDLLIADSNRITSVEPLTDLTGLSLLYLRDNDIHEVAPLSGLTQLTDLVLADNDIADVTPLATLTQLVYLEIDGNRVPSATPLQQMSAISYLTVGGNPLTNSEVLQGLADGGVYVDVLG
ncbi:leucine-rich repeat domain-containing protein [Tessaracoccus massiliensis]|uniref:leucine-rich repeat domain-containing protein n=1 Tax=Tessaracoccus massiliensis TaxID=1522311 RepID=UPI000694A814|nr:leucine-rich repeat domain-containing protein [Tessaracoccus massiliensis]